MPTPLRRSESGNSFSGTARGAAFDAFAFGNEKDGTEKDAFMVSAEADEKNARARRIVLEFMVD